MKIGEQGISLNKPSTVEQMPEEGDDIWFLNNIISAGDRIVAAATRKVVKEKESRKKDVQRVNLAIQIKVETVSYEKDAATLRLRGKSIAEDNLSPATRRKKLPSDVHVSRDASKNPDLAVLLMHEGLAHFFLVGGILTTTKFRIQTAIPRKHADSGYEAALNKFFESVLPGVTRHVDFKVVRCLVIDSPGFRKVQFRKYMLEEAEGQLLQPILENKSQILVAHSSSGYKHSMKDVLEDPKIMEMITDAKAAKEVLALKNFNAMLTKEESRTCYGLKHVEIANEQQATQTLLITECALQ
ncbi:protein PELOTA 1-like [Typha angustifolia]|uniref:protein PELOTA 1-like n=1 Tax=Typha angustifolia TaxID=59011 RepID=UPI003C2F826A